MGVRRTRRVNESHKADESMRAGYLIQAGTTHPPRFADVRYLLWGEAHISSRVHIQVFDNPTTSLQARVIRAVLRYPESVRKGELK